MTNTLTAMEDGCDAGWLCGTPISHLQSLFSQATLAPAWELGWAKVPSPLFTWQQARGGPVGSRWQLRTGASMVVAKERLVPTVLDTEQAASAQLPWSNSTSEQMTATSLDEILRTCSRNYLKSGFVPATRFRRSKSSNSLNYPPPKFVTLARGEVTLLGSLGP